MRRCRFLILLLGAALALAACVRQGPLHVADAPSSDLDALAYGAPSPAYQMKRGTAATVRAEPVVAQAVPVVQPAPVLTPPPPVMVRAAPAAPVPAPAFVEIVELPPYTLDAGDKLRIVVFGQDTLSNIYTVDVAGVVTMPLIGSVRARGLTTRQLSGVITGRLKQGFVRDPNVAVEVDTYRPFFVLGEVTYPGQYPYVPNMTVETAIAVAGGFTPRAAKSTVVVTRKFDGLPARLKLPMQAPVQPDDAITIRERWF